MRILIDLQGRQTKGSRNRGIGRYSLSIAKAIIRNRKNHEIIVFLSDAFEDTIKEIEDELIDILPKENIYIWNAIKECSHANSSKKRIKTAQLSRELFIKSLEPDLIYITSLFEGYGDDAVVSVKNIYNDIPVAVTLYDLIPLINKEVYLENVDVRNWYENKLEHLKNSDLLLSISESSRQEAINYLNSNPKDVVNIKTAADPQFKKMDISEKEKLDIFSKYDITNEFLMYTGGIDFRKNIEGLIQAYSLLSHEIRNNHQLAIVCSIDNSQKTILEKLVLEYGLEKNEVIFTGFVPENDLIILYNTCKAFIFPSIHEGFGLPALEAMHCGAPVIASNTSSLPEVVGYENALFDPKDLNAIKNKIEEVLISENFRKKLVENAKKQIDIFSWDNSAKIAINAFENIIDKHVINNKFLDRLKLAYISPLPPEHTGIADYSAELIPYLSIYYDIDVLVEQEDVSNIWIKNNCKIINSEYFIDNCKKYDRVLYHFGNSHFHKYMFKLLKNISGVVVLHDFFLSGVVNYSNFVDNSEYSLGEELNYSHEKELAINSHNILDIIDMYPCNKRVIDNSIGIIVHSKYSKVLAEKWYGKDYPVNWKIIPHLRELSEINKNKSRKDLGFSNQEIIVCSFGIVDKTKQNHRLLEVWSKTLLAKDDNCKLIFVGEYLDKDYGEKMLSKINNSKNIKITGRASSDDFKKYLSSADIGVQLRTLSRGETSGTVLDCMNYGIATIVNANGSMADLDNDSVYMLPDEFTDNELIEALNKLYIDNNFRNKLSTNARKNIEKNYSPTKCANQYINAIENFYLSNNKEIQKFEEKKNQLTKGLLVYGPYIALNDDVALFELSYNSLNALGSKYDIVADGGKYVIKEGLLNENILEGIVSERIKINNDLKDKKFEFRVWYDGIGELTVKYININNNIFYGSDLPGQLGIIDNKTKKINI